MFFVTLFLFGLLTWVYVVAVQFTRSEWLSEPLSHINIFPLNLRVDVTWIVGFIISEFSFFAGQLMATGTEQVMCES